MSDNEVGAEWTSKWRSHVALTRSVFQGGPGGFETYEHIGPVEFKLDAAGNLRLQMVLTDGTEADIALHLAGTFSAVSQELVVEDDTQAKIESLRAELAGDKDVTEGGLDIPELLGQA